MIEKSATRFNEGDYFVTVIDTDIPSCEIFGFIDGQPVDFSGGGSGDLTFGTAIQKLNSANVVIEFDNIPAEPKCFVLTASFNFKSSDNNNYIACFAKFGNETIIKRYLPSTGVYTDTGITITPTFNNNKLTLTSSSMQFSSAQSYVLVYAY